MKEIIRLNEVPEDVGKWIYRLSEREDCKKLKSWGVHFFDPNASKVDKVYIVHLETKQVWTGLGDVSNLRFVEKKNALEIIDNGDTWKIKVNGKIYNRRII